MNAHYVHQVVAAMLAANIEKQKVANVIEQLLVDDETLKIERVKHATHKERERLANRFKLSNEMYETTSAIAPNVKAVTGYNDNAFPHDEACNCNTCLSFRDATQR